MAQVALVLFCLLLGVLLRGSRRFPEETPRALNAYVIWISLPALILVQLPKLSEVVSPGFSLWVPVSMAWVQFGLSFVFFWWLAKLFQWSPGTRKALTLTAGLGNTSFVGLPLLEALYGRESVPIGVLVDQPGSFLVLATLGIWVASGGLGWRRVARNVLCFPPFVALLASAFWIWIGLPGREGVLGGLSRLADTLVPIALVAVGFQLKVTSEVLSRRGRDLAIGLGFKLVLAPLFFSAFYFVALGEFDFVTRVTLLESAMAPMITSAVVANEFERDGELANLMVGVGIPVSLVSVPLAHVLIERFA